MSDDKMYSWEPNLEASGNIVIRLCRIISKNMNYRVYFDNYYMSVLLMIHLKTRQICNLGTVRKILPNQCHIT